MAVVSPFMSYDTFPEGYDHNLCHELLNMVRRCSKVKEAKDWVNAGNLEGKEHGIYSEDGAFWGAWRMLSKDTMAIAFRGTQTGADWNSNTKYFFTERQCAIAEPSGGPRSGALLLPGSSPMACLLKVEVNKAQLLGQVQNQTTVAVEVPCSSTTNEIRRLLAVALGKQRQLEMCEKAFEVEVQKYELLSRDRSLPDGTQPSPLDLEDKPLLHAKKRDNMEFFFHHSENLTPIDFADPKKKGIKRKEPKFSWKAGKERKYCLSTRNVTSESTYELNVENGELLEILDESNDVWYGVESVDFGTRGYISRDRVYLADEEFLAKMDMESDDDATDSEMGETEETEEELQFVTRQETLQNIGRAPSTRFGEDGNAFAGFGGSQQPSFGPGGASGQHLSAPARPPRNSSAPGNVGARRSDLASRASCIQGRSVELITHTYRWHSGFYGSYRAIVNPESKDNLISIIRDKLNENPNLQVCVAGFSLGGAIATYTLWEAWITLGQIRSSSKLPLLKKPIIYTFGTPRPGDRTFQKLFNYHFLRARKAFRVLLTLDPVPDVPPRQQFYRHVGLKMAIPVQEALEGRASSAKKNVSRLMSDRLAKSSGFAKYHRVGFYVRCIGWAQEDLWNYDTLYDENSPTLKLRMDSNEQQRRARQAEMSVNALAASMADIDAGVPRQDKSVEHRPFTGVFSGKDAVDWMMGKLPLDRRDKAVDLGAQMQARGLLRHPISADKEFKDDSTPYVFTEAVVSELPTADIWNDIEVNLGPDAEIQKELEALKKKRRKRKNKARARLAGGAAAGAVVGGVVGVVGGPLGVAAGVAIGGAIGGAASAAYNRRERHKEVAKESNKSSKELPSKGSKSELPPKEESQPETLEGSSQPSQPEHTESGKKKKKGIKWI
mmetsp:Transcript_2285/g.6361  ORF Transcript_2285/g.6361 Transcript_2285/m.6361 type:complete len:893 (+) Transcript_2285:104-2782(+)